MTLSKAFTLLGGLLVTGTAGLGAPWDITADYSATSNPTGAWSFGRKLSVSASAMDVFTVRWGDSGWYLGNVGNGGPSVAAGPQFWAKANGTGVPQDYAQAVSRYHKAAAQGHVAAQNNLGRMYEDGEGVPHSDREAVEVPGL